MDKEKHKQNCKDYYIKNRDLLLEKSNRRYVKRPRTKIRKPSTYYYEQNKEKVIEKNKKYVLENPEKIIATQRKWYLKSREKKIQDVKKWIKNNPIKHQIYSENRRAATKATNDGTVTEDSILRLLQSQHFKCVYCKNDIKNSMQIDHKIPLSKNGMHSIFNIQLLCRSCNSRKNNKTHEQFIVIYKSLK